MRPPPRRTREGGHEKLAPASPFVDRLVPLTAGLPGADLQHLKHDYPYLFSLAIRTNPFGPDASPVFR
jgi:hypothetical protein